MRRARDRPVANHLALQQHFPHEAADARKNGAELKPRVPFGGQHDARHRRESQPETGESRGHEQSEDDLFNGR